MASGASTAAKAKNGISVTCGRRRPANHVGSWYRARYRWDGSNLLLISAPHRKQQDMLQLNISKQASGLYPHTSSSLGRGSYERGKHRKHIRRPQIPPGGLRRRFHLVNHPDNAETGRARSEGYIARHSRCLSPKRRRHKRSNIGEKATKRGGHLRNNKMPIGFWL